MWETSFIIEIDRTHNENTIMKMEEAEYHKCIWVRWGKITEYDITTDIYDVIKVPLAYNGITWNSDLNTRDFKKHPRNITDFFGI